MNERILAVDDDAAILELVSDTLADQGLEVCTASSGEEALERLAQEEFAMVILDIMMGGISGLEVCQRIRDHVSCPILFLSAKSDVKDIVQGLGLGGDDYMTKPFALEEMTARIQAHLRRQNRESAPKVRQSTLQIGEIELDPEARTVTRGGATIALSTREFELLSYLMRHAGQTVSRERIFRDVWETDYGDVGTVAINIKKLRAKLDPEWAYIKTVWGSGYRFVTKSGYEEQTGGGGNG
jgi:DNA-binding response OmpR family regulator